MYTLEAKSQEGEGIMATISTQNLRRSDVPLEKCNWYTFSEFALTFDPMVETKDESDQLPASATPCDISTAVALRYFLYCWQRIGNNQGGLTPEAFEKVQTALHILRTKV
ncbi:hypothetical protein E7V67_021135 [[Empedobacter] haloabium]|uniref:Uncharacterized protein n=1 Tax=[Empedobacter] haloabium TaxID=592317 RepID=A0ABZ1UHL1_9BURK